MSLQPIEIAAGVVFGVEPREPLPRLGPEETALSRLEQAVLPGLLRPPCLVSFSGGRDSSAVLAVAASVARREGLPLPVPATNRFPAAPESDESAYQELVVRHLGLENWVRLEFTDELDCVGPVAAKVLRRHGVMWPFNAHFHEPILAEAKGGSLLTGAGGDEVFAPTTWARTASLLSGRVRPEPRDALRLAFALSPSFVRARVLRRYVPTEMVPWLREAALRQVVRAWSEEAATEPVRWAKRFEWWRSLRYVRLGRRSLELLGADHDVQVLHPFDDPGVSAAIARLRRDERPADRTAATRDLFGDLLPDELLARDTKASFDVPFWNRHSRALVESWDGEDVDTSLVDLEGLRSIWTAEEPNGRTFLLLQSAWLARDRRASSAGGELEQTASGRGE